MFNLKHNKFMVFYLLSATLIIAAAWLYWVKDDLLSFDIYNGQTNASGPIVAEFRAEPLTGVAPFTVEFYDLSTGKIKNRLWDFGDGQKYSTKKKDAQHTYNQSGNYNITLEVSGLDKLDKTIKYDYIKVLNPIENRPDPNCSTGGSTYACIDRINPNPAFIEDKINFEGSGYNNKGGVIKKYLWTVKSVSGKTYASDKNPSFSLPANFLPLGSYLISFQVKSDVWSNIASKNLNIVKSYPPFGINNPFMEDEDGNLPKETSDVLKDLGAGWVSDSIFRRQVETAPYVYNWSPVDTKTREYYDEAGLKILLVINPKSDFQHGDGRQLNKAFVPDGPQSLAAYEDYVAQLVSRYKNKVVMWSVFNEPMGDYKNNIDDYVELIGRTYYIIKSINPQAQVLIGGVAGPQILDFHGKIFKGLGTKYPEIIHDLWFDYHTYSWVWKDYDIRKVIRQTIDDKPNTQCEVQFTKTHKDYVDLLTEAGWSAEEISTRVINKEGSTHTGEFLDKESPYWCYPTQTEFQQAEFLLKRAVEQAYNKVRIIQWSTLGEKEIYQGDPDSQFTINGLIYLSGVKKLSYYTLKFLIENLRGSDFDNVQIIETNIPNVRLYEFQKTKGPIYALWWDYWAEGESGETKQITIPLPNITGSKVKITEAVPNFLYDFQTEKKKLKEKDYPGFFKKSIQSISNSLTITLGKRPVYIEAQ